MKKLICVALVFVMVLGNASLCYAEATGEAVAEIKTELTALRSTGYFSFSVKAQGQHYVEDALSLEVGETVRIDASYSPASASIYIGLVDEDGKFHYVRATNGQVDVTLAIEVRGVYRLAVVNNSASVVSISGYVTTNAK